MALRLLKPARNGGRSGMRYLVILAACGLLCSCAGYKERLKNGPDGDLFKTKAELEADDSAKCQGYGAQPGTDVYIQCMVGLAQVRATNTAARRAAASAAANRRANEAAQYNNTPATQAGVTRDGRGCLGQTVQTPYGPQFNCY
jgi:hypothetical protein